MTKRTLMTLVVVVFTVFWSLLAWGASGLLAWLSELSVMVQNGSPGLPSPLREGILLWVPQTVLDAWLPWLQASLNRLISSFPALIIWINYAIWIVWGLGIALFLLLISIGGRFINRTP